MPAYVTRPQIHLPAHKITTGQILDDIAAHHPDHPRLNAILRVVAGCGVNTRYFTQPLDAATISGTAPLEERITTARADAVAMAHDAAQRALDAAGLFPHDVDAIITSHSTSWGVPGLEILLTESLGLAPTTRRLGLTTLACAGGTQALIRAAEMVTARPGTTVLVVVSEVISAVYNHADNTIESMIYKALFGDSAGACLVTSEPLEPGLRIDDTWEYLLPASTERYTGRLDPTGLHFDSTKAALNAPADVLPHLTGWAGPHALDYTLIHPGSRPIINAVAAGLGMDDHDTRHSIDTLTDEGNLGGVSMLRVLDRTHTDPPADQSRGIAVAFGPGFTTAALRTTWCA
ncbi:PhlD [Streptomyces sp. Wb2n-11]|uniref:PhlD n=1 Tax=Streptomyces sp. Wb2n-11 TaxID=1030533 RepID=UPI000A6DD177|nr:PhlD [Streptomyces sp. Wb2n-11]